MFYSIVTTLLQPLTLIALLAVWGVFRLWRDRQVSRRRLLPVTVAVCLFILTTVPAVVYPLMGSLEWGYPPRSGRVEEIDCLVVLGGGIRGADTVRPEAVLSPDSVARCIAAARQYQAGTACPVVVTGGQMLSDATSPTLATLMRDFLVELGVAPQDILVEDQARSTFENAQFTKEMIEGRQIHRLGLVTDAAHMWRTMGSFEQQGLVAVPIACRHRATRFHWELANFLPSAKAAVDFQTVVHEWLGLTWYWIHGRI
jgi:uncharacterized SAM-binding protein YcdF (DUF218 family)